MLSGVQDYCFIYSFFIASDGEGNSIPVIPSLPETESSLGNFCLTLYIQPRTLLPEYFPIPHHHLHHSQLDTPP